MKDLYRFGTQVSPSSNERGLVPLRAIGGRALPRSPASGIGAVGLERAVLVDPEMRPAWLV
jgi:hypothetical protein